MTDKATFKARVRARQNVTGEPYARARTLLLNYPPPSDVELSTAARLDSRYDPVQWQLIHDTDSPLRVRRMGLLSGDGPDCHHLSVPDHFGPQVPGKPDGELALIAQSRSYKLPTTSGDAEPEREPMLAIECVDIIGRGNQPLPGAWWHSFGVELYDRGFRYDAKGGTTCAWRVELTPAEGGGQYSAPVGVRVHDGAGWVLFDGVAVLPPSWITRAKIHPVGLLVVAGPVSGALFPEDADKVKAALGTADVIAARMLVDVRGLTPALAIREDSVQRYMEDHGASREEAEAWFDDPGTDLLCTTCGWTNEMTCPECSGCGCDRYCTGWRHEEYADDGGAQSDDEYGSECRECGNNNDPSGYNWCDCA